jgi:elongation factor 1-gamma
MWVDFITLEVESVASEWYYPLMGYGNQDPKAVASAKAATLQKLSLLDAHLATNTFFVGNYVTLADIVGYAVLSSLYKLVLTSKHRSEYPRLTRWFTTVVNQPQFKKVIGEFKFAETEKTLGGAEEKASDSKKEKKPAAAKKAPEPEPVGDDEDVPQPKKEKAKNPLDDLPKSNMVLDNVKRLFSNEPFASAAPKFWEEYDHEGYSVWECAYNYNSENKIFFMTCNLVGGYIQRLDPLRKYGYAALNVIGASEEQGPFDVCGIFLVRGTEMPAELKNCDDSEYYTWSRIDVTSDKGEARFAELWNSETINGKSLLERRWFK